nr:immunoglobulin heavy chain junction region [Macaca mulatta]MOV87813.1 immunoglobulin heavy chain junction region [Macaca mulatta]MOV88020.1 immunoglobulin heavy chain junction region [Macaca mulatta]MOV88023.1 immunoglobulin heavy chain junction region [Macaca mulatta]MOV88144.1 immunoglobulin heavy chain junction region [Macaca mulatta]
CARAPAIDWGDYYLPGAEYFEFW